MTKFSRNWDAGFLLPPREHAHAVTAARTREIELDALAWCQLPCAERAVPGNEASRGLPGWYARFVPPGHCLAA